MLKKLLEDPLLKGWIDSVRDSSLISLDNQAKLCGVDLYEDYLAFKLYIELKDLPQTDQLLKFVPSSCIDEIRELIPFRDTCLGSSLGLGYKLDNKGVYRNYLHLKVNPSCTSKILTESFKECKTFYQNFKLIGINPHALIKGISYEIFSNEIIKKVYLYIKDPFQIKKMLLYKKLYQNLNLEYIDHLETYVSPTTTKINIINNNDYYIIKQDAWLVVPEHYKTTLKNFESLLDTKLLYTGFRDDSIFSAYFSLSNLPNNVLGI